MKPSRLAALAAIAFTPDASAQRLRVSLERAVGVTWSLASSSTDLTTRGVTTTTEERSDRVSVNFFGVGYAASVGQSALLPAALSPRLAVDYELTPRLSVGAAAFFAWSDDGDASVRGVGLAPRVGYVLPLSRRLAFWPRAGVTVAYVHASSASAEATYVPLWVDLEPTLTLAVDDHFAFSLGVVADLPLVGHATSTSRATVAGVTTETQGEGALRQFVVGAQLGVLGRF